MTRLYEQTGFSSPHFTLRDLQVPHPVRTLGENAFLRFTGIVIVSRLSQVDEIETFSFDSSQLHIVAAGVTARIVQGVRRRALGHYDLILRAEVETTKSHGDKIGPRESAAFVGAKLGRWRWSDEALWADKNCHSQATV